MGLQAMDTDAPLSLVIDIIIEQGLFQSRYEIQAFRLESIAHGTGAPADELQVEGVSSHSDLRKIFSSLASDSSEDSIFPTTFKKVDKILHEMKEKVGLGGPNPKDSSSHTRTNENVHHQEWMFLIMEKKKTRFQMAHTM
ncbi:hypothetical protein Prudu_006615 [Prunus dulcis]|uniref:DUF7642 domain-containing protein n=1 Tax=Prunus dulcis TaxID=3755 RepID=A0A4Y1R057_PRUDU|nr:hypothetical protein Prudu_006615 [Prunus dulcis]